MELPTPLAPPKTRKLSNGLLIALSKDAKDPLDRVLVFFPRWGKKTPTGMAGIRELADRLTKHRLEGALEAELQGKAEAALSVKTFPGGVLFQVAGRRGQLKQAQGVLLETLMDPRVDPSDLARSRAQILRELGKYPKHRLLSAFVSEVLGLGVPFPDTIQGEISGIKPAALSIFLKLSYRPKGAVVLLQGKGWKEEDFRDLGNDLMAWKGADLAQKTPKKRIPFFSFADSPQFEKEGELLLLLPSPAIEDTGTPLSELCWQLFCMDGLGGRLRQELGTRGLDQVWIQRSPLGDVGGARLLSLSAPGVLPKVLIEAVQASIASLRENSPSLTSLDAAKRRVLLSWDRKMNPPSLRAETLARGLANQLNPNLDLGVLRSLQSTRPDDIPEAASTWLKPAFLFVSAKSTPPSGAIALGKRNYPNRNETTLGNPIVKKLPGDPKTWEKTKATALAKARQVLGLTHLPLNRASKSLSFEIQGRLLASLPFQEHWNWDFAKGEVQDQFQILKTKIQRSFSDKGAAEHLDGKARKLGELEAESYLQSGLLNPLVLLHPSNPFVKTIQAQGNLKLKEGKDLILLSFDLALGKIRLKASLGIDPDTGLPRRLLYDAPIPGGSRVRTIYLLQEYRMEKGLRFPHTLFRFDRGAYRGELSIQ
jgi:predicted Zn-dependent peptidase